MLYPELYENYGKYERVSVAAEAPEVSEVSMVPGVSEVSGVQGVSVVPEVPVVSVVPGVSVASMASEAPVASGAGGTHGTDGSGGGVAVPGAQRQIRLQWLRYENFMGAARQSWEFGGADARILGGNGAGKTTAYHAFTWLLFGKDCRGNAEFDLKPKDADGAVRDHGAVTAAEAELTVDGEALTLRRTWYEKWTLRRGGRERQYEGNGGEFFIDGVPVQKKAYDAKVRELAEERLFLALTNVWAFPLEMDWRARRALLLELCHLPDDRTLLAAEESGRFRRLAERLGRMDPEHFKKKRLARRAELNGAQSSVPARLDEQMKTVRELERVDFDAAQARQAEVRAAAERLRGELSELEHGQLHTEKRCALAERENALRELEMRNREHRLEQLRAQPQQRDRRPELQEAVRQAQQELVALDARMQAVREAQTDAEAREKAAGAAAETARAALERQADETAAQLLTLERQLAALEAERRAVEEGAGRRGAEEGAGRSVAEEGAGCCETEESVECRRAGESVGRRGAEEGAGRSVAEEGVGCCEAEEAGTVPVEDGATGRPGDWSVCPVCGRTLPPDQLEEARQRRLAELGQNRAGLCQRRTELEAQRARCAMALKQSREAEAAARAGEKRRRSAARGELKQLRQARQTAAYTLEAAKAALETYCPPEPPELRDLPLYAHQRTTLEREAAALRAEMAALEEESEQVRRDLRRRLDGARAELTELDRTIALRAQLEFARRRCDALRTEAGAVEAELADIDRDLDDCEAFTRYKAQFLDRSVNRHFQSVRFRLFERQVNGGLRDCCEVLLNGARFGKGANTGAEMAAGLEIIGVLSRHYGVSVPVFVDGCESVERLPKLAGQVIRLEVDKRNRTLRCEIPPGDA